MKKSELRELINEVLTELSPDTLNRYLNKLGTGGRGKGEIDRLRTQTIDQYKKGDFAGGEESERKYQKRTKGMDAATNQLNKKSDLARQDSKGDVQSAVDSGGTGPRIKNPSTGQEIYAATAYRAGPTHPAYNAAKAALKKEVANRKLNENSLLLKNLLRENMERRVNLMKVSAIMDKVLPEVSKEQGKKLTELFTEVSMLATQMNVLPYTKFNITEWQISVATIHVKLHELKEEVVKIADKENRVDLMPLVRALEEVCQQ